MGLFHLRGHASVASWLPAAPHVATSPTCPRLLTLTWLASVAVAVAAAGPCDHTSRCARLVQPRSLIAPPVHPCMHSPSAQRAPPRLACHASLHTHAIRNGGPPESSYPAFSTAPPPPLACASQQAGSARSTVSLSYNPLNCLLQEYPLWPLLSLHAHVFGNGRSGAVAVW